MHYIAPEYGDGNVSVAADIYAFGICALEMAVLEIQGNGDSRHISRQAIRNAVDMVDDIVQKDFLHRALDDVQRRPTARDLLLHPVLFEVHSLKLLAAHSFVKNESFLQEHLSDKEQNKVQKDDVIATIRLQGQAEEVQWRVSQVPALELEKFLEEVRNGIHPLTAFAMKRSYPVKIRPQSPETQESVKSATPEPIDMENRKITMMQCDVRQGKEGEESPTNLHLELLLRLDDTMNRQLSCEITAVCRSCIVRYLHTSKQCPVCDTQVHKTRPLLNIRSDKTLQNLVYKLVPSMFKGEMKRRREFYKSHPEASTSLAQNVSREELGEMDEQELIIYTDDEHLSLSLEYYQQNIHIPKPKPAAALPRSVGNGDNASTSSSSGSSSSSSDTSSESGGSNPDVASGTTAVAGGSATGSSKGNTSAAAPTAGDTQAVVTAAVTAALKAAASGAKSSANAKTTEEKRGGQADAAERSAQERLKGKSNGASTLKSTSGPINGKTRANGDANGLSDEIVDKRYLRCPAAVSIGHIKKFIRHKFGLSLAYQIEVMYRGSEDELLPDEYTLMDVAYIYTWGRVGPMPLVYRVYQPLAKPLKRTLTDKNASIIPEKIPKKTDTSQNQQKILPTAASKPKDTSPNQGSQENTSPATTPGVQPETVKSNSALNVPALPGSVVAANRS